MGKTRLGLQAAAEQIDIFQNGVFFVPLAGVTSVDNLPSTIAKALKLSFYGAEDLESQLHNYLREKHLLLVLDNFEHLIDGARSIANILAAAPEVKVLATSRRRLSWVQRGSAPSRAEARRWASTNPIPKPMSFWFSIRS